MMQNIHDATPAQTKEKNASTPKSKPNCQIFYLEDSSNRPIFGKKNNSFYEKENKVRAKNKDATPSTFSQLLSKNWDKNQFGM